MHGALGPERVHHVPRSPPYLRFVALGTLAARFRCCHGSHRVSMRSGPRTTPYAVAEQPRVEAIGTLVVRHVLASVRRARISGFALSRCDQAGHIPPCWVGMRCWDLCSCDDFHHRLHALVSLQLCACREAWHLAGEALFRLVAAGGFRACHTEAGEPWPGRRRLHVGRLIVVFVGRWPPAGRRGSAARRPRSRRRGGGGGR
mmetsp:Transcript_53035/g.134017  ORF Transcript_53035/g.134017 Transcript_53035/m.134017 type:complete len:202 (+) Transcript_53035:901-1506(+)